MNTTSGLLHLLVHARKERTKCTSNLSFEPLSATFSKYPTIDLSLTDKNTQSSLLLANKVVNYISAQPADANLNPRECYLYIHGGLIIIGATF